MNAIKKFWKNWNEAFMFLTSIVAFFVWPPLYRMIDPTAGAFDAGMLHVVVTGFLIVNFILFAAWMNYKLTWPVLHKWFDDKLELHTVHVTQNFKVNLFAMAIYFAYVAVYTVIFAVLI